jgi:hypothetical protein
MPTTSSVLYEAAVAALAMVEGLTATNDASSVTVDRNSTHSYSLGAASATPLGER